MANESYKDLFKRASEIAAVVPEAMQPAAFQRALDMLMDSEKMTTDSDRARETRTSRQSRHKKDVRLVDDPAEMLIEGINRTKHPEVAKAAKALDRSLMVLRIAQDEFDIDGLTAVQIARVLTERFRLRTTRQRVSQVLDGERAFVDRVAASKGSAARYRLMAPGERHLDQGLPEETTAPKRQRPRRQRTSKVANRSKRKTGARGTRRGPRSALDDLVSSGYFSEPRTIGEVREYLESKRGLAYKITDLSPAFTRMLRSAALDRDKNDLGKYEYRSK